MSKDPTDMICGITYEVIALSREEALRGAAAVQESANDI